MQRRPIRTPVIHVDPRHQARIGTDARSLLHDAARTHEHPLADFHIVLDDHSGPTLAEAAMRASAETTALA